MTAETPVPNLEAQIASLQTRNAWLERQVELEKLRVPQNYTESVLGKLTLEQLADLPLDKQADLFIQVAHSLNRARVSHPQSNYDDNLLNLEWNGELPHPTWTGLDVDFRSSSVGNSRNPATWVSISAVRHDGAIDEFMVLDQHFERFVDRKVTPVLMPKGEDEGNINDQNYARIIEGRKYVLAEGHRTAKLLDFARGVRGGTQVLSRRHYPNPSDAQD